MYFSVENIALETPDAIANAENSTDAGTLSGNTSIVSVTESLASQPLLLSNVSLDLTNARHFGPEPNTSFSLVCELNGDAISWIKDDKEITNEVGGYQVVPANNSLIVQSVGKQHPVFLTMQQRVQLEILMYFNLSVFAMPNKAELS